MIVSEFSKYLRNSVDGILLEEKVDPRRTFFLRPSSLPFCGLRRFLNWAKEGISPIRETPVSALYYTRVGTTTHEVFQQSLGQGGRILGNWKCRSCDYRRELKTYRRCKKCGDVMLHEEVELDFLAWRGHLDGIYVAEDGSWWVIDYKTCGMKFIEDGSAKPSQQYIHQQNHYVALLEQKLMRKISGWMLVFLARENPMKHNKIFSRKMRDKTKENLHTKNIRLSKLHKRIFMIESAEEVESLVKHKHCQSIEDHDRTFRWNPCEFKDVCFKKGALTNKIDSIVSESKHLPLVKFMPKDVKMKLYANK